MGKKTREIYGSEWVMGIVNGLNSVKEAEVERARRALLSSTYGKYTVDVRVDRFFDVFGCRETEALYGPGYKRNTRKLMRAAAEEGLVSFVKRYDPSRAPSFESQSAGIIMMRCAAKDILANIRKAVRLEFNRVYGLGLTESQFRTLTAAKRMGKLGFLNDYTPEELSESTQSLPKSSQRTPERIARLQYILKDLFPGKASEVIMNSYEFDETIDYPEYMITSLYERAAYSYAYNNVTRGLTAVENEAGRFHAKRGVMTKYYHYAVEQHASKFVGVVQKAVESGVVKENIGEMIIAVKTGKRQVKSYSQEYDVTAACIGSWIKKGCQKIKDTYPDVVIPPNIRFL